MAIDWQRLLVTSSEQIIRERMIPAGDGGGVLWTDDPNDVHELSALGVIAWAGRDDRPSGAAYEWTGRNLLCNAAPRSFMLNGELFHSVDSFYEALKLPEGSSERVSCARSPLLEARRLSRRVRSETFPYRGKQIPVGSEEHEALLAAAISAKVQQNLDVRTALRHTGATKLALPRTPTDVPGALARVTPITLMIERWKLARATVEG